jgi:hypothetical protein
MPLVKFRGSIQLNLLHAVALTFIALYVVAVFPGESRLHALWDACKMFGSEFISKFDDVEATISR